MKLRKHIYVIQAATGEIKIGVTYDITARFTKMQSDNPRRLKLLYLTALHEYAELAEAWVHKKLKDKLIDNGSTREWFEVDPEEAIHWVQQARIGLDKLMDELSSGSQHCDHVETLE